MTDLYNLLKASKTSIVPDMFTAMIARKTGNLQELEGIPPLNFNSVGNRLLDYKIYGNTGGVGDRTANLFDKNKNVLSSFFINSVGQLVSNGSFYVTQYIDVIGGETYWLTEVNFNSANPAVCFYDFDKNFIFGISYKKVRSIMFETPNNCYFVRLSINKNLMNSAALTIGSTALPYEPYGYKIPVTCGGETTNIYLDEPLGEGEYISYADTGVEIPTINGENTLTVNTEIQPEKVYIKYKGG